MFKHSLEWVVFLCGASLMVLELVGSRVLAPYIGTSIVVWTSLIGIILGFLSLGYWWGGKWADRGATLPRLSGIIVASAAWVFLVVLASPFLLKFIQTFLFNLYFGAIFSTLLLFAVPSFLLGIVSPYAVRLKMKTVELSGRTVGDLYAISTIGSIVGTFAAGFILIPFLGTTRILFLIAIILVASSLIAYPVKFFKIKVLAMILLLLAMMFSLWKSAQAQVGDLIDVDTQYNRIWIYQGQAMDTPRPTLRLATDPFATQSGMFLDKDDDVVFRYMKYYRLADVFNPNIKNALIIGAAAYSYPKDFLKKHGGANLDVVEIDPGMTKLAKKYFHLKDDPRLAIYHEDGRVFLNQNKKKYDAIYLDAFNSHLSIPYQLTTREAVQKVYDALNDEGVVLANVISALEGEQGRFFRAEYATYREIFPDVRVFRVYNIGPDRVQNLVMAAFKTKRESELTSDNAEAKGCLDLVWRRPIKTDLPVLTDDYAPVDYYTMNLIEK